METEAGADGARGGGRSDPYLAALVQSPCQIQRYAELSLEWNDACKTTTYSLLLIAIAA